MNFLKLKSILFFCYISFSNVYQIIDISKTEFDVRCKRKIDINFHENYFENYPNEKFKVVIEYPEQPDTIKNDTLRSERYIYIEEFVNQDFGIEGTPNNNLKKIPVEIVYIYINYYKKITSVNTKNCTKVFNIIELPNSQLMRHIKIISPKKIKIIRKNMK